MKEFAVGSLSIEAFREVLETLESGSVISIFASVISLGEKPAGDFFIRDHINLGTENPFFGHKSPDPFFGMSDLYRWDEGSELLLLAFVSPDRKPTDQEIAVLKAQGVGGYCAGLATYVLLAAKYQMKVRVRAAFC